MQDFLNELDGVTEVTTEMFQNAKTLLEIYKKVKFRVEGNLVDIDAELYMEDRQHLTNLVHSIIDFDTTIEKKRIQEKLVSNSMNLCLLEVMEDALLITKKYPEDGELYYKLLRYRYFDPFKNTNQNIMEMLDMTYSTYYRKMNKAVQLYSAMLWGISNRNKNGQIQMAH